MKTIQLKKRNFQYLQANVKFFDYSIDKVLIEYTHYNFVYFFAFSLIYYTSHLSSYHTTRSPIPILSSSLFSYYYFSSPNLKLTQAAIYRDENGLNLYDDVCYSYLIYFISYVFFFYFKLVCYLSVYYVFIDQDGGQPAFVQWWRVRTCIIRMCLLCACAWPIYIVCLHSWMNLPFAKKKKLEKCNVQHCKWQMASMITPPLLFLSLLAQQDPHNPKSSIFLFIYLNYVMPPPNLAGNTFFGFTII